MLIGGAELDPLVAEAGGDAGLDHRLEHVVGRLVANAMQKVAARPHLLQRGEIAALVMHAGEPIADELLGDESERVAVARARLGGAKALPLALAQEHVTSA